MIILENPERTKQWFVMRDLKRPNALRPAYLELSEAGFEVFTPMHQILRVRQGVRRRVQVPFINDLLFVNSTRPELDPVVAATPTLQYRFLRGVPGNAPTVVRTDDMERFIAAVKTVDNPEYFSPSEITPTMLKKQIRIVGGQLDGYEGILLTVKGSKVKKLMIEIPGLIAAAIEVEPQFIQLIKAKRKA